MRPAICSFRRAIPLADFENGWLYEAGIGENRAIRVEQGQLVGVRLERHHGGVQAGAVVDARFRDQWVSGQSGIVALDDGQEALLQPLPKGLTEGATVRVEIVREALHERGVASKRAKARPAAKDAELQAGHNLFEQVKAAGGQMKQVHAHEDDLLAALGWHDVMEQAATGHVEFDGGSLLLSQTPAMTVIDVDGPLPPFELAKRAAKAIARTLARLDITGNIGVDFPTLEAKTERSAVAAIFDDQMTAACERTAINGFGFMQIVTRKARPSVLELVQKDKVLSAAIALLRQAERERGTGGMRLDVHPAVAAKLNHRPQWLGELSRRVGRAVTVEANGNIAITGGQIAPAWS